MGRNCLGEVEEVLAGKRRWCVVEGDCLEVLPLISGVDLVFTSPPYNLGELARGTGGFADIRKYPQLRTGKWGGGELAHGYGNYDDARPYPEYVAWQKECLFAMWKAINDDGAIYYNHKPRVQEGLLRLPLELNPSLPVRQIVIWARSGGINFTPSAYLPSHEWIVIFAKPGFRLKSKAASGAGDVWYIPQEPNPDHPAPFPVKLPLMALETVDAEIVLDPFAGICSTGVACLMTGKRFIGIELNPAYCETGRKRLEQAEREQREILFPAQLDQQDLFAE